MSNYEIKPQNVSEYSSVNELSTEFSEGSNYCFYENNDDSEYQTYSNTVSIDNTKQEKDETKKLDNLLENSGYVSNMSSFEHLPPKFLGIDTRNFGKSFFGGDSHFDDMHPFLHLKKQAMDLSVDYEDRFQCIRYMIHIPYINCHEHCLEACKTILEDENIEVNKRFYFFSNNDKFFKLTDQLVYDLQPFFFRIGVHKKYPFKILSICARYILSFYPDELDCETDERDNALDFILDLAEDKSQSENVRGECADILYSFGREEEVIFGMKILQEIGYMDQDLEKTTFYTNRQNVHDKTINESVRKIINKLHKDYLQEAKDNLLGHCTLEFLHNLIYNEINVDKQDEETNSKVDNFFIRVMTDPTRFENLNLSDILVIVLNKIKSFDEQIKKECYKRLLEEIKDSDDTCHTGYVSRLVNVLSGFVEGEDYILTIDPRDELRSAVFARLNTAIANLPTYLKEDVTNSLWGDDKSVFEEFLGLYGETIKDELIEEYKNILTEKEVNDIYEKSVKKFQGF